MTYDTSGYDIAKIRELLTEAFTSERLRRFCQDRPVFQPVVVEFSPGSSLSDMIDRLIDYCRTKFLWGDLLAAVKEENPRQWERFGSQFVRELGFEQAAIPLADSSIEHAPLSAGIGQPSSVVVQTYLSARPIGVIYTQSGPKSGMSLLATAQARRIVFGRTGGLEGYDHADHKVEIPDVRMSRNHFGVWVTPTGSKGGQARSYEFVVEDLGSANGTFVNGERIGRRPRLLSNGDLIQAGGSEFTLHLL